MKKFYFKILFYAIVSFNCYGSDKFTEFKHNTLCKENEYIYASCILSTNKIVSFCGNEPLNSTPDTGYVQYRYGTQNKIEMIYPKNKTPPQNKIFYIDNSGGSVSQSNNLIFFSGEYQYSFSDTGIASLHVRRVLKNNPWYGRVVFSKKCDETKGLIYSIPNNPNRFKEKSKLDYPI